MSPEQSATQVHKENGMTRPLCNTVAQRKRLYIYIHIYNCMYLYTHIYMYHQTTVQHRWTIVMWRRRVKSTADTVVHHNSMYVLYYILHTLQHTAIHCNALQHTATEWHRHGVSSEQLTKILQYTATHCNTLQYTATHCNTLQHTATEW